MPWPQHEWANHPHQHSEALLRRAAELHAHASRRQESGHKVQRPSSSRSIMCRDGPHRFCQWDLSSSDTAPCRKFQWNKEKKRASRTWFRKLSGLQNGCQGRSYFIFLFFLFLYLILLIWSVNSTNGPVHWFRNMHLAYRTKGIQQRTRAGSYMLSWQSCCSRPGREASPESVSSIRGSSFTARPCSLERCTPLGHAWIWRDSANQECLNNSATRWSIWRLTRTLEGGLGITRCSCKPANVTRELFPYHSATWKVNPGVSQPANLIQLTNVKGSILYYLYFVQTSLPCLFIINIEYVHRPLMHLTCLSCMYKVSWSTWLGSDIMSRQMLLCQSHCKQDLTASSSVWLSSNIASRPTPSRQYHHQHDSATQQSSHLGNAIISMTRGVWCVLPRPAIRLRSSPLIRL
jgi:hypothetical protein